MPKKKKSTFEPINNVRLFKAEKMYNRPLSFYKNKRNKMYNISYFLIFLSFCFVISGILVIENKNKKQEVFITTVLGDTYEYEYTAKRNEIVNDFLNNYNKSGKENN